jgi:hypothetical protein
VFRQWQSVSEGYQNLPFDGPPAEVEKERKTSKAEETLPAKKQAEERLTKNTLLQAEADVAAERRDRLYELSEQEEESDEDSSERDSEDGVLNEEISMLELQMLVRKNILSLFFITISPSPTCLEQYSKYASFILEHM